MFLHLTLFFHSLLYLFYIFPGSDDEIYVPNDFEWSVAGEGDDKTLPRDFEPLP